MPREDSCQEEGAEAKKEDAEDMLVEEALVEANLIEAQNKGLRTKDNIEARATGKNPWADTDMELVVRTTLVFFNPRSQLNRTIVTYWPMQLKNGEDR